MDSQKFTVGESLSFGWNAMKKHFWFFLVLLGLSTVIGIIVQATDRVTASSGNTGTAGDIIAFVGLFLSICISVALIKAQLVVSKGKDPSYQLLKPGLLLWFKLFLTVIITGLIKIIGFLLLFIPGVYVSVKLQFVFYAVVEHGYWPFQAIAYSWRITRGHWWDLLLFNIASFGVNLLGGLALLVGLFASVPTTRIASAHVYDRLAEGLSGYITMGSKTKYIIHRVLEIAIGILVAGGLFMIYRMLLSMAPAL